jgi:hypothetical protein
LDVLEGRGSTSSISVRNGDRGDMHALLDITGKVVSAKPLENLPIMDILAPS